MSPARPAPPPIRLRLLGTVPYTDALDRMRAWTAARHAARTGGGDTLPAGTPAAASAPTRPDICRQWPDLAEAAHAGDEIWLMQHPPVFTLGMNARPEHLLAPGDIPVVPTERGGQVTYHGPGQLMAYLMLELRPRKLGIRRLVEAIEQALIDCLHQYGITALRQQGAPGIYVHPRTGPAAVAAGERLEPIESVEPVVEPVGPATALAPTAHVESDVPAAAAVGSVAAVAPIAPAVPIVPARPVAAAAPVAPESVEPAATGPAGARPSAARVRPVHRPAADVAKIASIGLKTSNGFSYHGLALNAQMDLSPFARINPCGYRNLRMTDIHHEQPGQEDIDLDALALRLGHALCATLER